MRRVIQTLLIAGIAALPLAACTPKRLGELSSPEEWRVKLQPPLDEHAAASLRSNPSLHDALLLALNRNPGVAARRQRWLAAIHAEPQATSLPDPVLQGGYQFENVETRVGPQRWSLGLNQTLPWWHKLWARGERAALQADIARLQYEAASRDLIIDVKNSWYELYYLDQALRITRQVEDLLRGQATLAYSESTIGRAAISEAFRAESQTAQLGYDRILLSEQRAAQAERMRSLLNLPPDTPIGTVAHAPVYEIAGNLALLQERAEIWQEALAIKGLEVERAEYDTFLAKLERIPDVTLGANYIATGDSRASGAMEPGDSGKDPVIGMLSMNLPIWEQRNRALIREKQAMEEAMELEALEELNQVRQAVAQAWFRARLTQRLAELYAQELLPQAEAIMRQSEMWYRGEQAAFSSVLETTMAWHNFTLAYHRAIAGHGQAIGQLERAIGATAEPMEGVLLNDEEDAAGRPSVAGGHK